MHTVVVGGGFGGIKAALEISKRNLGRVTLILAEPYFLHHATLYATATGRSKAESVIALKDIFARQSNVTVVHDTMKAVDADRKLAVGINHSYPYDELVIAIGVVTTYFDIRGMREYSYGIKTLEEVRKFKQHLHDELTIEHRLDRHYVVVGAGPTGVELAGALNEYLRRIALAHHIKRGHPHIMLVEAADRILPRLSKTASRKVAGRLKKNGIKVLTGKSVEALDDETILIAGKKYPTHTAVWTSGVMNHPFFRDHGELFELAPKGRVMVDQYMSAAPHIYVIGDNAATPHTGLARTALWDASFIAAHLSRAASGRPLVAARHPKPVSAVPVDEKWAYVEWKGVYAASKTGAWLRRQIELAGYLALSPRHAAYRAWRAHNSYEEECQECENSH